MKRSKLKAGNTTHTHKKKGKQSHSNPYFTPTWGIPVLRGGGRAGMIEGTERKGNVERGGCWKRWVGGWKRERNKRKSDALWVKIKMKEKELEKEVEEIKEEEEKGEKVRVPFKCSVYGVGVLCLFPFLFTISSENLSPAARQTLVALLLF